jgi:hypothetical protein
MQHMKLELSPEVKRTIETGVALLKGSAKRLFMATLVSQLGRGGQRLASKELGWNRDLIRKGLHELRSGISCVDNFSARGRKRWEERNPELIKDIKEIVDAHCETDPTFRTTRLYRRLTAGEVRRQLLEDKGYCVDQIPKERSMRDLLGALGFHPRKVVKSKPLKKIKETDAIFNQVHQVNQQADADPGTVRISLDTKAVVAIGDLSRGGKSRQDEHTSDHDFESKAKVTPFGVFRPDTSETWLYFTTGSVTADFMVDRLQELWPGLKKNGNTPHTLVINADNGPENSGVRSQWLKRLVAFSAQENITIQLAYYPPYHSKYNPIERVFGVLENYWNGDPLRTIDKALGMAEGMTYKGIHPVAKLITDVYKKGVKLNTQVRSLYEKALDRLQKLHKWFITITPDKAKIVCNLAEQLE